MKVLLHKEHFIHFPVFQTSFTEVVYTSLTTLEVVDDPVFEGGLDPLAFVDASEYPTFVFVLCSWVGFKLLDELICRSPGINEGLTIEHQCFREMAFHIFLNCSTKAIHTMSTVHLSSQS